MTAPLEVAPEIRAALPTFLIIGAPKCATTSLHIYLDAHPDIAMTRTKEPMVFARDDWVERMQRYPRMFRDHPGAPVRGESSTAYASYPWQPDAPARVQAAIPDCHFVYLVRDPIERMLSHYAQNVWDGMPVRPFDELMEDLEAPDNIPVWSSRYAVQLERWTDRFGADRVLVLDSRDLQQARERTLQRVLEFLGLGGGFTSPQWALEHNTAAQHRVATRLGRRLGRLAEQRALRPLLTREVRKPQLTSAQRERVVALLAPDARRFREMTGLSFDHWSV